MANKQGGAHSPFWRDGGEERKYFGLNLLG